MIIEGCNKDTTLYQKLGGGRSPRSLRLGTAPGPRMAGDLEEEEVSIVTPHLVNIDPAREQNMPNPLEELERNEVKTMVCCLVIAKKMP